MDTNAIGVDFGTTNSSLARALYSGGLELAQFPCMGGFTDAYRSLLYLVQARERGIRTISSWTGPEGIERYLADETKGRLIQSLKSFLTSRTLQSTDVFGRRLSLEDLIARILRDLREKAELQFGFPIRSAVVGRPVRFVGAENEADDSYAEARLRLAFQLAGYEMIEFELEPVAAAYYYESSLAQDQLILIGDFGGGTSDFSLLHVGPGVRRKGRTPADLLGNAGVGVAGDAFDAKIIRHLVSPALGLGTYVRSMNKSLPVPSWVYSKLERWHHLSLLRSKEVIDMLKGVSAQALEPAKVSALIRLVGEDLGYHLHQVVQKVKAELSVAPFAQFRFNDGVINLEAAVDRSSFEEWISEELGQIESCVDALLNASGVCRKDIDMVFLTGGSSFVPAVKRIFEERFGTNRIRTGNEFTSVARGLALKARELSSVC